MIHLFDSSALPVSRWRNGGGETREIISFPPGREDFSWRISIATIAADGPFSVFPGVDRTIVLLEGDGVELTASGKHSQLLRHALPFAFAGEEEITARLPGGASTDFNIMTRRATHRACVSIRSETFTLSSREAGVIYVLEGEWLLGERRLAKGQGAWWERCESPLLAASGNARLLLATITAKPGI